MNESNKRNLKAMVSDLQGIVNRVGHMSDIIEGNLFTGVPTCCETRKEPNMGTDSVYEVLEHIESVAISAESTLARMMNSIGETAPSASVPLKSRQ
jgi:hypothetical protein